MNKKIIFAVVGFPLVLTSAAVWADHEPGHDETARGGVKVLNERIWNLENAVVAIQDDLDALGARIDAEEAARIAADNSEAATRSADDASLQTQIDDITAAPGLRFNPLQVALLRWYEANESPIFFGVGENPIGAAFDGANIWVANSGAGTVSKLRASDGAPLGDFIVGQLPAGVAFDGAHIWVTSSFQNFVSKL